MGSVGNTFNLENAKADLKQARQDYQDFINKRSSADGGIRESDIPELMRLQKRVDELTYDVHSNLSPTVNKDENWKGTGITDLTRQEAQVARQDMLKNRSMFLAIQEAMHGVSYEEGGATRDTAVDKLYKSDKTGTYNIFKNTRDMLRKKYGDTITLYRVPTSQTSKATVNMTSTRANAEQYARVYGGTVKSYKIPVSDVLAVNVTRTGGYEEFIVLNKKR